MSVRILVGHVLDRLAELPAESVHCAVTSPPYFGLRDYKIPPVVWDGDPACAHEWGEGLRHTGGAALQGATSQRAGRSNVEAQRTQRDAGNFCQRCGAWRGALGLEPTPNLYLAHLLQVMRAVKRVLRKDGTLWLNLGDSYAGSWGAQGRGGPPNDKSTLKGNGHIGGGPKLKTLSAAQIANHPMFHSGTGSLKNTPGLKPKDLMLMPARVALALQADGWFVRSEIIWAKPNPMPESCTDRPTSAHEHIWLLSKSARYFYDAEAVKEPMSDVSLQRLSQPNVLEQPGGPKDSKQGNRSHRKALNNQAERLVKHEKWKSRFEGWDEYDKRLGRNLRNVWTVATAPFPEAHFATFPPALVEPCIKAGCPRGGTVLDPFGGAGTVGLVADRLQRDAILIELNADYAEMARARIARESTMFAQVAVETAAEARA